MSSILRTISVGLLFGLLPACASWELTKRDIVEPFNQLVHFDLPAAFERQDVGEVTAFYAPELRAWGLDDAVPILLQSAAGAVRDPQRDGAGWGRRRASRLCAADRRRERW